MMFSDLYDQIARNAGETGGTFRSDVRRWLNLARAEIADGALWRTAFRPAATITTAAATTSGLYLLTGYEHVAGNYMQDETNRVPLQYEAFETLNAIDPDKTTTGNPQYWSDAGFDQNSRVNTPQVYLWPIPDGAYTIRFAGYIRLADIAEADDGEENDTYFGWLTKWASCFTAGIDYYRSVDDNEDAQVIALKKSFFKRAVSQRKTRNAIAPASSLQRTNVRTANPMTLGRFDPAHFSNNG